MIDRGSIGLVQPLDLQRSSRPLGPKALVLDYLWVEV